MEYPTRYPTFAPNPFAHNYASNAQFEAQLRSANPFRIINGPNSSQRPQVSQQHNPQYYLPEIQNFEVYPLSGSPLIFASVDLYGHRWFREQFQQQNTGCEGNNADESGQVSLFQTTTHRGMYQNAQDDSITADQSHTGNVHTVCRLGSSTTTQSQTTPFINPTQPVTIRSQGEQQETYLAGNGREKTNSPPSWLNLTSPSLASGQLNPSANPPIYLSGTRPVMIDRHVHSTAPSTPRFRNSDSISGNLGPNSSENEDQFALVGDLLVNVDPIQSSSICSQGRIALGNSENSANDNDPANPYQQTISINQFATAMTNDQSSNYVPQAFVFGNPRQRMRNTNFDMPVRAYWRLETPQATTPRFGQADSNPDTRLQPTGFEEDKIEVDEQNEEEEVKSPSQISIHEESINLDLARSQLINQILTNEEPQSLEQAVNDYMSLRLNHVSQVDPSHDQISSEIDMIDDMVLEGMSRILILEREISDSTDEYESDYSDTESSDEEDHGMSEKEIQALPVTIKAEYKEEVTCAICQSKIETGDAMIELLCGHEYHADWIKPWLQKSATCPLDRLTMLYHLE